MRIIYKTIALIALSVLSLGFCLNVFSANSDSSSLATTMAGGDVPYTNDGVSFSCDSSRLSHIKLSMTAYLTSLGIAPNLVLTRMDQSNGVLTFTLNTPKDGFDTLQLKSRPEYEIRDRIIRLPDKNGEMRKVVTVSKKEILLALFQHGRLTEFSGRNCNLNALKEQVNIRQNIVAWSENLNWNWPDGGHAEWNAKYWHRGTPLPNVTIYAAFDDAFKHQEKYSIGCYTATKLVMVQGILDYYHRIKNDKMQQKLVEERLVLDQEPLVDIEPGEMWSFEKDFGSEKLTRPGKILKIQHGVAPRNFVPGDWVFILNNDPISSQKTGYEGSNAIYLGRNKFDDYYNDNNHSYTYQQKLNEVYQWRNGVFSRSRDSNKIKPLSSDDFEQLGRPPSESGLVHNFRVFPISFLSLGS